MARATEITWAGGEHPFLLTIELLRAVQSKCDAGPAWILARLTSNQWFVDDVIEPIRLGLEGGGASKAEARSLVQKYVEDRPLTESLATARTVLMASLYSVDGSDDPVGEQPAATE